LSQTKISEDDFEARVAAAMAAYKTAGPDAPLGGFDEPESEVAQTEVFTATPVPPQNTTEPEIVAEPTYTVPTFEYHPPVSARDSSRDLEPAPVAAESELVDESTEIEMHPVDIEAAVDRASSPVVESAVRAAAAAAGAGSDHQAISQAVHRAMEKLKPDLV